MDGKDNVRTSDYDKIRLPLWRGFIVILTPSVLRFIVQPSLEEAVLNIAPVRLSACLSVRPSVTCLPFSRNRKATNNCGNIALDKNNYRVAKFRSIRQTSRSRRTKM